MSQIQKKYEQWDINKLIPYARNARTHSDEQIAQLAASIKEWGWTTPVLCDPEGGIIAGHGRVLAARKLDIKKIPVLIADGWTDSKKKAYILADNKLALNAGWDDELVKLELSELMDMQYDISNMGFSAEELNVVMNGWQSNIDVIDKHGENLDGINPVLKIRIKDGNDEFARETITNALEEAGIEYEFA